MINTKEDLNNCSPEEKANFIKLLKGSITRTVDLAVYPDKYDQSLQEGDEGFVAKQITEIEDLSTIISFGFTKDEIGAM